MKDYFHFYKSPLGLLRLKSDDYGLKSVSFVDAEQDISDGSVSEILRMTIIQLNEYFEGKRFQFNLNLDPEGTVFQQQVWNLVQMVEYGKTKNYGDIAKELGSARFSRAVGMANGKNPLPIIIPCHRIIGINGKLVGYSGGMERKKWLLLHEQRFLGRVLF